MLASMDYSLLWITVAEPIANAIKSFGIRPFMLESLRADYTVFLSYYNKTEKSPAI